MQIYPGEFLPCIQSDCTTMTIDNWKNYVFINYIYWIFSVFVLFPLLRLSPRRDDVTDKELAVFMFPPPSGGVLMGCGGCVCHDLQGERGDYGPPGKGDKGEIGTAGPKVRCVCVCVCVRACVRVCVRARKTLFIRPSVACTQILDVVSLTFL